MVIFGKTTCCRLVALVRQLVLEFVNERRQRNQGKPSRVLLADDSNALRAGDRQLPSAQGIDVTEVQERGSGSLGASLGPRRKSFDAVVTDLEMAPGDGFDRARGRPGRPPKVAG